MGLRYAVYTWTLSSKTGPAQPLDLRLDLREASCKYERESRPKTVSILGIRAERDIWGFINKLTPYTKRDRSTELRPSRWSFIVGKRHLQHSIATSDKPCSRVCILWSFWPAFIKLCRLQAIAIIYMWQVQVLKILRVNLSRAWWLQYVIRPSLSHSTMYLWMNLSAWTALCKCG